MNLISLESPEDVKEGQFGNKYDQGLGGLLDNSPHPDQPTSLPGEAHPPDSPREPGTIEVKPPGSRPDSPGHPNPNAPTAAGVELVATALVTTIWSRLFARRERKDKN